MTTLPNWVPEGARHYIVHTEAGLSIRQLARDAGCHASTVMRQVRKFENRRDDPLIDGALRALGSCALRPGGEDGDRDAQAAALIAIDRLEAEAERVLRRLGEPGAVLAVADGMDRAVVVRDTDSGTHRTAVVERDVAQAMALKDWIACVGRSRVARYRITAAGRQMLARLVSDSDRRRYAEAQGGRDGGPGIQARRARYSLGEPPLLGLARRRDRQGLPFLSREMVRAGERLREDYELAGLDGAEGPNWTAIVHGEARLPEDGSARSGPPAARARVAAALRDLGPGLGDVVLRCCCRLEGLESAERDMGWSARSGKIVLRIALQRLRQHYEERADPSGALIG